MTELEKLVNVPSPLDKAFAQLVPESIQEAHEIQRQRIKDKSLWEEWFLTGDGCVYNIKHRKAVLYFTSTKFNPVLKQENIADAFSQIMSSGNYKVRTDDFSLIKKEAAKKNGRAQRYALSKLELNRGDEDSLLNLDEWSYFEIDTKKFDKLNKTQRALAEQVHGKGKQFSRVMREMNKALIKTTRIYVLNPEYVKKVTEDGPVARLGFLQLHMNRSDFIASDRHSGDDDQIRIRGVRRETVAEGDAAKIQVPCPEEILAVARDYVPNAVRQEFKQKIRALYK